MRDENEVAAPMDNLNSAIGTVTTTGTVSVMTRELLTTPQSIRILGGAGTGKTQFLIDRVKALLEEGVSPEEILVFATTPIAATTLQQRLCSRLGLVAQDVAVTTARAMALQILAQEEAISLNGRPARLLADFEVNFLLEDMKTSGIRPSRLKEILKFFYRGWTELAEDDPEWLITVEEQSVHALLIDNLRFIQGMLEPELSKMAVNYLRSNDAALSQWRVSHVLVDDLQCHSRASQLLAHLLAGESIVASADRNAGVEVFDSYPYLLGVDEFLTINPDAECRTLETSYRSSELVAAQNALLDKANMDASSKTQPASDERAVGGQIIQIASETMGEEFSAIAARVHQMLAEGYKPGELALVTFNQLWSKQIAAHLRELGVPVQSIGFGTKLKYDIRDLNLSAPLRILTALRLIANSTDATSWRCWCGFGDYLANSAFFMELKEKACLLSGKDVGLVQILKTLGTLGDSLPFGSEKVLESYKEAISIIETCKDIKGTELLERLAQLTIGDDATLPAVLRELFAGIDVDADAATMINLAEKRLHFPGMESDDDHVAVLSPENLCSLSFRTVILCGLNDGFLPCRDYFDGSKTPLVKQEKMRANDARLFYLVVSAAREDLVISHFRKIDLENAERLKLKISRIRMEKGQRICLLTLSDLVNLLDRE